jgi:hypothetical protein
MAIGVRCEDCGTTYEVAASFAGSRMQCPQCTAILDVPNDSSDMRVCVVCGKSIPTADVKSDLSEISNASYYCDHCSEAIKTSLRTPEHFPQSVLPQPSLSQSPLPQPGKLKPGKSGTLLPQPSTAAEIKEDQTQLLLEAGKGTFISAPVQSDLGQFMTWLSTMRLPSLGLVAVLLLTPATLILTYYVARLGVILGAMFAVAGMLLLGICIVWVYALPFRDGPFIGFRCLWKRYHRGIWFGENFPGSVQHPGKAVKKALGLLLLAASYFYIASLATYRTDATQQLAPIQAPEAATANNR